MQRPNTVYNNLRSQENQCDRLLVVRLYQYYDDHVISILHKGKHNYSFYVEEIQKSMDLACTQGKLFNLVDIINHVERFSDQVDTEKPGLR